MDGAAVDPSTTLAAPPDGPTTTLVGPGEATTTTTVVPGGPTTTAGPGATTTALPPPTAAPPPTEPPVTVPEPPSTTAVPPPPRPTIPLEDAKRAGLWGRPRFDGCTSTYGDTSPGWLDDAIAASAWPKAEWGKLCRVIGCESNFHADSVARRNGQLLGLLQIHDRSWRSQYNAMGYSDADLLRPGPNLAVGLWLWREVYGSRWTSSGWSCARA